MRRFGALGLVTLVALGCAPAPPERGWPGWRGPRQDGSATSELPAGPRRITLEWRRPLGPGFSSVSVAGDIAVTMFSDGELDRVVALQVADGERLWSTPIGPTHRQEHPESHDGPLSTPTINDGTVYAVGGGGELLAVRLDDGVPVWSMSMPERLGARAQQFGFATSPTIAGDTLVVLTGAGDGRSTCGLDPATGETRWCHGFDPVGYQSPIRVDAAWGRHVAVATDRHIVGLDPASGEELWRTMHIAEVHDGVAQLVWAGDGTFLMSYLPYIAAFRLDHGGDGRSVVELWRSQELLRSLAAPVIAGTRACGFRRGSLACVGLDDGATVVTREGGVTTAEGRGLLRVDDTLVVWDADGVISLVEAGSETLREIDRLETGLADSYTAPSFAAGRVFVRNHGEIAAVRLEADAGRQLE